MTYKVEVVKKDDITEIRYIGSNPTENMAKIIELDEFRDVANVIMKNNPTIAYNQAFVMAKDLKYKGYIEKENTFEKAKVKVLTLDKNAS